MPEELKMLAEWKERLGLHDWTITLVSHCRPSELNDDADGDVEYVESTKCARIRIVDPALREESLRPFDFELCLIHELLHCKLSLLMDGDDWEKGFQPRFLHTIVDDLARAFASTKSFYKTYDENKIKDNKYGKEENDTRNQTT